MDNRKPPLNRTLKARARSMRREMTAEEKQLWFRILRNYPVKFRRQQVMAPFICDFYCEKAKLIIEVDGSQHYFIEGKSYDQWRSEFLEKDGNIVLRFSNEDIKKRLYGVYILIDRMVNERLKELEVSENQ